MTKASLAKARDGLDALAAGAEALRRSCEENAGRLSGLERSQRESEARLQEQFDTRLNKQGKVCKDMGERQAELIASVQRAKSSGENTSAALKKLLASVEQQRTEDCAR